MNFPQIHLIMNLELNLDTHQINLNFYNFTMQEKSFLQHTLDTGKKLIINLTK